MSSNWDLSSHARQSRRPLAVSTARRFLHPPADPGAGAPQPGTLPTEALALEARASSTSNTNATQIKLGIPRNCPGTCQETKKTPPIPYTGQTSLGSKHRRCTTPNRPELGNPDYDPDTLGLGTRKRNSPRHSDVRLGIDVVSISDNNNGFNYPKIRVGRAENIFRRWQILGVDAPFPPNYDAGSRRVSTP